MNDVFGPLITEAMLKKKPTEPPVMRVDYSIPRQGWSMMRDEPTCWADMPLWEDEDDGRE